MTVKAVESEDKQLMFAVTEKREPVEGCKKRDDMVKATDRKMTSAAAF